MGKIKDELIRELSYEPEPERREPTLAEMEAHDAALQADAAKLEALTGEQHYFASIEEYLA